jgi:hypothetical protein
MAGTIGKRSHSASENAHAAAGTCRQDSVASTIRRCLRAMQRSIASTIGKTLAGGYSVSIVLKWHRQGAVRASRKFGFTDLYQLGLLYKGVNVPGVDRERVLLEVFGIIPGVELPDN